MAEEINRLRIVIQVPKDQPDLQQLVECRIFQHAVFRELSSQHFNSVHEITEEVMSRAIDTVLDRLVGI